MKLLLQKEPWDCGPTCLLNALALRGRSIDWESAVRWTKATPEKGTSAAKLKMALKWLRVPYTEYLSDDIRRSWTRLTRTNRPAFLCVDKNVHWVLLVGGVGRRIIVWDPDPLGGNGMCVYGRAEFLQRWVDMDAPKRHSTERGRVYGIYLK